MTKFEALFGITPSRIKKNCILMPCLPRGMLSLLGLNKSARGKLYAAYQGENFTLIHTGIGASFLGDAVLYLKNTPAKNLILFGSCGLIKARKGVTLASLVSPAKAYNLESFSRLLFKKFKSEISYPDKGLYGKLLDFSQLIKQGDCATLGSLKLEEENIPFFTAKNIPFVEMECAAFFNAAKYAGKKAAALFYVSDIVKHKPFYKKLSPRDNNAICASLANAASVLCKFITCALS